MAINAEISKTGSENSMSVIRKFTRKFQGTGVLREVRGRRYHSRASSAATKKKGALKRIARREAFAQLVKEGKVQEREPRRRSA